MADAAQAKKRSNHTAHPARKTHSQARCLHINNEKARKILFVTSKKFKMKKRTVFFVTMLIVVMGIATVVACSKLEEKSDVYHTLISSESKADNDRVLVGTSSSDGSLEIELVFDKDRYLSKLEKNLSSSSEHDYVAEDIKIWNEAVNETVFVPVMSVSFFDIDEELGYTVYFNPVTDTTDDCISYYVSSGEIRTTCTGICKKGYKCVGELDKFTQQVYDCRCTNGGDTICSGSCRSHQYTSISLAPIMNSFHI